MNTYLKMNTWSDSLGMCIPVDILMPNSLLRGQNAAKVMYLLHGLSDDETVWARRTNLEMHVDGRGLCVVMPTVHRSFYTNIDQGPQYWTYISEELPEIIGRFLRVSSAREDTFAAGISMGGYGAVKLGLRCPERFCAVAPISGALDMKNQTNLLVEYESIFGKQIKPEDDVMQLLDRCAPSKEKPRIIQFCGVDDFLRNDNIAFYQKAQQLGYDITYTEEHGNHGWSYWDHVILQVLDVLCPRPETV